MIGLDELNRVHGMIQDAMHLNRRLNPGSENLVRWCQANDINPEQLESFLVAYTIAWRTAAGDKRNASLEAQAGLFMAGIQFGWTLALQYMPTLEGGP